MRKSISHLKSTVAVVTTTLMAAIYHTSAFAYDGAIIDAPDGKEGIEKVLSITVDIMTAGVAILAVIGIVISGIQYLTAGGNEDKLKKSKRRIFEIVIGLAAYVIIYALLKWLLPTFNGINAK